MAREQSPLLEVKGIVREYGGRHLTAFRKAAPFRAVDRVPFSLSTGQSIVADEPVSALGVSIRAQVLDLFADLNRRLGIAYLFITHDLTVARAITDEVIVMHDGKIVERGVTNDVLDHPHRSRQGVGRRGAGLPAGAQ